MAKLCSYLSKVTAPNRLKEGDEVKTRMWATLALVCVSLPCNSDQTFACNAFKVCQHIQYCISKYPNPWQIFLKDAATQGSESGVQDYTSECQERNGTKGDWDNDSGGCNGRYAEIGNAAVTDTCGKYIGPARPPGPPPTWCCIGDKCYYNDREGNLSPYGLCTQVGENSCHCGDVTGNFRKSQTSH